MAREVKNKVKELRTERGWTQEQLAHAVGVSRQSINSIERQRYEPSLALALTFARVFGRATDEIFSLEEKNESTASRNAR
jgi:putative transcriptional regulator